MLDQKRMDGAISGLFTPCVMRCYCLPKSKGAGGCGIEVSWAIQTLASLAYVFLICEREMIILHGLLRRLKKTVQALSHSKYSVNIYCLHYRSKR